MRPSTIFQRAKAFIRRTSITLSTLPKANLALIAVALIAFVAAFLVVVPEAFARAGGGHSYSRGRSSRSSSSGGGGESEVISILLRLLIEFLIWLCREYPAIGYPLVVLIIIGCIVGYFVVLKRQKESQEFSTTISGGGARQGNVSVNSLIHRSRHPENADDIQQKFRALRAKDPDFSRPLFEDFIYFLYGELQRGRTGKNTDALSAFATDDVLQALQAQPVSDVSGIVIGTMKIFAVDGIMVADVSTQAKTVSVDILIEANLSETDAQGKETRVFVKNLLRLKRRSNAKSRPIGRTNVLDCPSCGAPLDGMIGRKCSYCGNQVGNGFNDWVVVALFTTEKLKCGPLLTSNVPEKGTNLPTMYSLTLNSDLENLLRKHPEVTIQSIEERLRTIWVNLQKGWAERDELQIRPFITDNLFQHMSYWLDLYRSRRCRNVATGTRDSITAIEIVSVDTDKNFDAITLRYFASTADYTVSDDGKLLSGSKTMKRHYSEYWTLIRGRTTSLPSTDPARCPSCGGDLKISASGNCEYCNARVSSGDFDWVLSRIEQDESFIL